MASLSQKPLAAAVNGDFPGSASAALDATLAKDWRAR